MISVENVLTSVSQGVSNRSGDRSGAVKLNAADYAKSLSEKYDFFNNTTVMGGTPVTMNVSPAYIEKCAANPEEANNLEKFLKSVSPCMKMMQANTAAMPGHPVMTYCRYEVDSNGNITMYSGCTNDPDGKIARDNVAKKIKERREAEKKEAERQEKKKELERVAEKTDDSLIEFEVTLTGTSVSDLADQYVERTSSTNITAGMVAGFDAVG